MYILLLTELPVGESLEGARDVAERAGARGVVVLDAPPAGEHCENASTWRWRSDADREKRRPVAVMIFERFSVGKR